MRPTPGGCCTHSAASPAPRRGTGSTSTPSPFRTWRGPPQASCWSRRSPWERTRERATKAGGRRRRRHWRARCGSPPGARRAPGHAPGGERSPRRQEPARRARRAKDGHRPLACHLPRRVGRALAVLERFGARGAGGGGRRSRAQATARGRQVLLSGGGLLATGREGAPLAHGVGAVRRGTRGLGTGGHASSDFRSARPEDNARPAAALEGLRREAYNAWLPRRPQVAPGGLEGGHRHPLPERRRRSGPDPGSLRQHAGDHGERRGVGAGGRRLRIDMCFDEACPGRWGGAQDGGTGGGSLPATGDDGARGVRGGRGGERARRRRFKGPARTRKEGSAGEALLLGGGDLRGAPAGAAQRRSYARGRPAVGAGEAVRQFGLRGGAGRDDGLRQLLSARRSVPERERHAGAPLNGPTQRQGVRDRGPVRNQRGGSNSTRDRASSIHQGALRGARHPTSTVLQRSGRVGRGALRGSPARMAKGPVAPPTLLRPQEALAVAGRGVGASGRRDPGGPRWRHDLDDSAAPVPAKSLVNLGKQRPLFEGPDNVAYLNCAYMSPQLRTVRKAGEGAVRRKSKPWEISPKDFFEDSETARALFAEIVGGEADGGAIGPSVSYGMAVAAANVPLGAGESVVILGEQFPSNVYPWRELTRRVGAELVTVPRPTDNDWTGALLERVNEGTAIVAVPNCHWTDGSFVDLVRVGVEAREVGAVLVVDGIQSL